MSCFTGCINTCKECFSKQDEKKDEIKLQSDEKKENNNNNKDNNQSDKENNANNRKTSLFTFGNNEIINKQSVEKINNIIITPPENNNSPNLVNKDNQMSIKKNKKVINSSISINENKIQNKRQDDTNESKTKQKVEKNEYEPEFTSMKMFKRIRKNKQANQWINGNKQNEIKPEQNNNININNNNNELLDTDKQLQQLIDEVQRKNDKKGATNNYDAEHENLKLKSKNTDRKKDKRNNKNKLQLLQKTYKDNNNITSEPSQTPKEIQKTDMHLHNFLTKIVIKICELEELFCEKNNGNCSKFWKNLVDDNNKKTLKKNDTLFTRVLDRNYNHHNIRDDNHILRLSGNSFMEIKGKPKTSEIINQMVLQKRCNQLERILRISNADLQQLEKSRKDREHTFTGKVLTDPMVLKIDCSPINKSIEIMLMLSAIQDMALKIYNEESNKQEKQHAKNILLFFRQVLTTLYKKKIISVINPKLEQGTVPVEEEEKRQKYWQQLNKQQQWKQVEKYMDFKLEDNVTDIQEIDLTKLFWKNGKQFDGKGVHHTPVEMTDYQQCIDEQPKFKLDNSIMLDEIKK